MISYYDVYSNGQYLNRVRAFSKDDAINQVYMKHGSASKYTGKSRNNFTAKKVGI